VGRTETTKLFSEDHISAPSGVAATSNFYTCLSMTKASSRWGTTALRRVLRVADGGSPSCGDSEGLC